MSNEFPVKAIPIMRARSEAAAVPSATATTAPAPNPLPAPSPIADPTFRLNAALGLVVIEFRNDAGTVTTSIPSQRQLAAYQRWETTQFGPSPVRRSAVPVSPAEPAAEVPEPEANEEKDAAVNT